MFNMKKIGYRISELRKRHNMTQMELADKMNISFQAVSNWERGNTMPDISKLPDLAELFQTSIDDLLDEKSQLLDSVSKGETEVYLKNNTISSSEVAQIAPILKPDQLDTISDHINIGTLNEIEEVLPFLDTELIEKLLDKAIRENREEDICLLAPFCKRERIDELALTIYQTSGTHRLADLGCFVSKEVMMQIAQQEYELHGLQRFEDFAVFLDRNYLNNLAKDTIKKDGLKAISHIAFLLDQDMLTEFVKEFYL